MDILFLSFFPPFYGKVMPLPKEYHVVSSFIPPLSHCIDILCCFIITAMIIVNMTEKMCFVISP
jgi:hypothetical protein